MYLISAGEGSGKELMSLWEFSARILSYSPCWSLDGGENISSRRAKLQRAVYRDSECVQGKWREQENRTAIFQERVEWVNCEWQIFPFLKILRPHKWLVVLSVDHWVTNASQFKIQEQIIFYGFQRFKIFYSGPHVFQCWWVWLPKIYYYFFLFLNN